MRFIFANQKIVNCQGTKLMLLGFCIAKLNQFFIDLSDIISILSR